MKQVLKAGVAVLVLGTAACSDESGLGPEPIMLSSTTADVCETISFGGVAHLETFESKLSALGLTLTITGSTYTDDENDIPPANPDVDPVAFNAQFAGTTSDPDLQSAFDCSACAGLGNMMILPDLENGVGDPAHGDYRWGGTMRISGFTGGSYYLTSFKA